MKFFSTLKRMAVEDEGISAVEYALLLALIGAGIATAAFTLGSQVQTNIQGATTALQGN